MCGIWGFIGAQLETKKIYQGLKKLEYRGYDSAGLVVLDQDKIHLVKEESLNLKPKKRQYFLIGKQKFCL